MRRSGLDHLSLVCHWVLASVGGLGRQRISVFGTLASAGSSGEIAEKARQEQGFPVGWKLPTLTAVICVIALTMLGAARSVS
jgi:hypothetical protein